MRKSSLRFSGLVSQVGFREDPLIGSDDQAGDTVYCKAVGVKTCLHTAPCMCSGRMLEKPSMPSTPA